MLRASTLLKNTRLEKDIELTEIEKKLKIPSKYLKAIEDENSADFPQEPYLSLITKDYAQYLGLDSWYVLKIFHRDYDSRKKTKLSTHHQYFFTPQKIFGLITFLAVILFLSYLGYEYVQFNSPPPLKVTWPESVLSGQAIEISGTTDPNATVRVNQDLVIVNQDGKFQKKLQPTHSDFTIDIEAESPAGKTSSVQKTYQ